MSEVKTQVSEIEVAANELLGEAAEYSKSVDRLGDALTPLVFQISRPTPTLLSGATLILRGLKAALSGVKSTVLAMTDAVPEITAAVERAQDKAGAVPVDKWLEAINVPRPTAGKKTKTKQKTVVN